MVELLEPPTTSPVEEDELDVIPPLTVRLDPVLQMDDEQFFQFCALNRDLRIERNADGDIVLMHPEGLSSGGGNAELTYLFMAWAKRDGTGRVFGSSTGVTLPNKAVRSPDVFWISNKRLRGIDASDWERFAHVCPDFVLELRSKTDSMRAQKAKMVEYLANGARLGWLINPARRTVFIYRPGERVEERRDPKTLTGEAVLPDFTLTLSDFWKAISGVV